MTNFSVLSFNTSQHISCPKAKSCSWNLLLGPFKRPTLVELCQRKTSCSWEGIFSPQASYHWSKWENSIQNLHLHRKLLIRSYTLQCQALWPFTKEWNHLKLRQFNGYSGYMYCRNKLDGKSLKLMGSSSDCKTHGEGFSYVRFCCACWVFTRNLVINCNDCQGWWQSALALPRSLWLVGWKCSVSIVLVLDRPNSGWFPS